jgi:nucleoside-diphosphate-sugar epimerase
MPDRVRILVTGSSGHLGEALVRVLGEDGHEVTGLDILDSSHTTISGRSRTAIACAAASPGSTR